PKLYAKFGPSRSSCGGDRLLPGSCTLSCTSVLTVPLEGSSELFWTFRTVSSAPSKSMVTDTSVPRPELNFGNANVPDQSVSVIGIGVLVTNGPEIAASTREVSVQIAAESTSKPIFGTSFSISRTLLYWMQPITSIKNKKNQPPLSCHSTKH